VASLDFSENRVPPRVAEMDAGIVIVLERHLLVSYRCLVGGGFDGIPMAAHDAL